VPWTRRRFDTAAAAAVEDSALDSALESTLDSTLDSALESTPDSALESTRDSADDGFSPASSAVGVVVTAQANFLRVVVNPEDMTSAQIEARVAQLAAARSRAAEAGALADVEKFESAARDSKGPYEVLCVVRALLKKIKRKVLVGDDVALTGIDWVDSRAMVHDAFPRRSRLVDPPVANVDRALLVFSMDRPPLEAKQLTRFLVSMENTNVPFDLVLNKCDLVDETALGDWRARLEQWGYSPRFVSVATGEGVDALEKDLASRDGGGGGEPGGSDAEEAAGRKSRRTRVTVLAGPSGVGKSSLINRLRAGSRLAAALADAGDDFDLDEDRPLDEEDRPLDDEDRPLEEGSVSEGKKERRHEYVTDFDISGGGGGAKGARRVDLDGVELQSVKAVSAKLGRGRHTTRHVTLLPLPSGGLLADTPGFGYPSLESLTVSRLIAGDLFPEIRNAKRLAELRAAEAGPASGATGRCKFANCSHRDEPGCAVDSVMPWEEERYDMYCDLYEEVEAMEKREREAGYKRETRVRYKDGSARSDAVSDAVSDAARKEGRDVFGKRSERPARVSGLEDADAGWTRSKSRSRSKSRTRAERSSSSIESPNDPRDVSGFRKATSNRARRMEPKLETKSDRRQSRRAFNMETATMEAEDADADARLFTSSIDADEDDDWEAFAEGKAEPDAT